MMLAERLGAAVFILFLLWQVFVPIARDRPIFPLFRRNTRKLAALKAQREAEAELEIVDFELETQRLRSQIPRKENPDADAPAASESIPPPAIPKK